MKFINRSTLIIAIVLGTLGLTACSSNNNEEDKVARKAAENLYQDAKKAMNSGLYSRAIEILSAIDRRFPYGAVSKQVQMDLIYSYYKTGETAQALAFIDRFIRLNPNHPNVDYVIYMRGLTNIQATDDFVQDIFDIDRADRDVKVTRQAFDDFKRLVTEYPKSKYAKDAKQRMVFLKNKLASYELKVADYYIRRGAYLAAANRGKYIVEYYPNSIYAKKALEIMVHSYTELGLNTLAQDTQAVLMKNYQ
ncbi:outer membrane protein assembly factor BamD [Algicola sagamiensis]|uniref:outer membrane protein assembly factor BamD n=1 Tax=Algicola sagamiensis TaxID=163869 RepID=UPI000379D022|nr:outer membrane protein assembly factor BamD [Algicola sagamiensis]